MPRALERLRKAEARTKHFGKERTNRYVYGTLNRLQFPSSHHLRKRAKRKRGRR